MINKISKALVKVFGSRNERLVKSYSAFVVQADAHPDNFHVEALGQLHGLAAVEDGREHEDSELALAVRLGPFDVLALDLG